MSPSATIFNSQTLVVAALVAATVAAVLGLLSLFALSYYHYAEFFDGPFDLYISIFLMTWLVGLFVAGSMLLILFFPFVWLHRAVSLLIFVGLGFGFPAYLGYLMGSIGAHGEPAALDSPDRNNEILLIAIQGFVGATSAFSAWWVLVKADLDKRMNGREPVPSLDY